MMSMLPQGITPITTETDGTVLDFVCKCGAFHFTDYYLLDEKIIAENHIVVKSGGKQNRITITSIEELKSALSKIVEMSIKILILSIPSIPSNQYTSSDFSAIKRNLLVDQLVFDVLFNKYLSESERMTRNRYSSYMDKLLSDDNIQNMDYSRSINERLKRGMSIYHDRIVYSKLREQMELLGVDPEKYAKYHNPRMRENSQSKKPKFMWDFLYYNSALELTYRQYRRQLTRDNRNYSYEEIIRDLKEYHVFVAKLLPVENESYEKYFRMSMDYYVLESYKRVDFIFKLIDVLPSDEIEAIDKNHFLVKRFVQDVLVPFMKMVNFAFTVNLNITGHSLK